MKTNDELRRENDELRQILQAVALYLGAPDAFPQDEREEMRTELLRRIGATGGRLAA